MANLPLLAAIAGFTALSSAAFAGPLVVTNTTTDVAYSGASPTGATMNPIGSNFQTDSLTYTATQSGGNYVMNFAFATDFAGAETLNGVNVGYSDIFLRTPSTGYSAAPFNYAIALGYQGSTGANNGGLSTPGFYSVGSDATSQQIWSGRSGFTYGGAYEAANGTSAAYAAPTVLTSGTKLAGANVSVGAGTTTSYIMDASITLTAAQYAPFLSGFNLFWGTADCANGSFFAAIPAVAVPEPATIALFAVALLGLGLAYRRAGRA